jgi:CRP/FNR family transcriptional regulator, cyclic AMP receptor protein
MAHSQRHLWVNPFRRAGIEADTLRMWKATPLLHNISSMVCAKLVNLTHLRQYQPGDYLFREGEAGVCAAVIIAGTISIESADHQIATLGPGDFFGEAALLQDAPRSASAIATSEATVSFLARFQLEEFVRHRPVAGLDIMTNLARLLVARLHRTNRNEQMTP